jgi:hypothetical protein
MPIKLSTILIGKKKKERLCVNDHNILFYKGKRKKKESPFYYVQKHFHLFW